MKGGAFSKGLGLRFLGGRARAALFGALVSLYGVSSALAVVDLSGDNGAAQSMPTPKPEPILPPVDLPWPAWAYWAMAGGSVLFLLLCWGLWRFLSRERAAAEVSPRDEALRGLAQMEPQVATREPYPFSIEVSDLLRTYITKEYRVAAVQSTSPEFLDEVARSRHFSAEERELLAEFLQRVDLIKFARHQASQEESALLLGQAVAFVKGGKRMSEIEEKA